MKRPPANLNSLGVIGARNRAPKAWPATELMQVYAWRFVAVISINLIIYSIALPALAQQSETDQGVPVQMVGERGAETWPRLARDHPTRCDGVSGARSPARHRLGSCEGG